MSSRVRRRSTTSLRHAFRAAAAAACLVVATAGCEAPPGTSAGGPPSAGGAPGSADVDPALLAPLTALGPCPDPPPAGEDLPEVEGLVLPDGSVVTSATITDPVATVQGWIPLTPVQVRVHYADRADIEVLQAEDEIRESEVLLTTGGRRLFLKAQAACDRGSAFVAVVAPEDAAAAVPTPAGAPSPTG
jgi:hypothetical protein